MTRLVDLNPRFEMVYEKFTPEAGGINPTGEYDITFTCPTCRPSHEIKVRVGHQVKTSPLRIWRASPLPPNDGGRWLETLSIQPSINNSGVALSRGRVCAFHAVLTNGDFQP